MSRFSRDTLTPVEAAVWGAAYAAELHRIDPDVRPDSAAWGEAERSRRGQVESAAAYADEVVCELRKWAT